MKTKMKPFTWLLYSVLLGSLFSFNSCKSENSKKSNDANKNTVLVYEEVDGILAFEAEHFYKQTLTDKRKWYITNANTTPHVEPDGDSTHLKGVSGNSYIEVLPDTRHNHDEELIESDNFEDNPGAMAVLHYNVSFNTPGRYYVWIRAYSSNSEDDAVHVGLDGKWPETGKRWRSTINDEWGWQRKRRNPPKEEEKPHTLLCFIDVVKIGQRDLQISMREDGAELDKIILSLDKDYEPTGIGATPKIKRD